MGIKRWLSIQFIEPQYNKAVSLVAHYKMLTEDYEKRYDVTKFTGRRKGTYLYAKQCLDVWELKKERFSSKLEKARRMER